MFRSCGNPGNGFLGLNGRFAGISEPSRNRGFKVPGLAFGFVYDQIWVSVLDLVLISVKFCCSKRAGEENYFQCNFSSNRITASHFYNMCCQRKRKVTNCAWHHAPHWAVNVHWPVWDIQPLVKQVKSNVTIRLFEPVDLIYKKNFYFFAQNHNFGFLSVWVQFDKIFVRLKILNPGQSREGTFRSI